MNPSPQILAKLENLRKSQIGGRGTMRRKFRKVKSESNALKSTVFVEQTLKKFGSTPISNVAGVQFFSQSEDKQQFQFNFPEFKTVPRAHALVISGTAVQFDPEEESKEKESAKTENVCDEDKESGEQRTEQKDMVAQSEEVVSSHDTNEKCDKCDNSKECDSHECVNECANSKECDSHECVNECASKECVEECVNSECVEECVNKEGGEPTEMLEKETDPTLNEANEDSVPSSAENESEKREDRSQNKWERKLRKELAKGVKLMQLSSVDKIKLQIKKETFKIEFPDVFKIDVKDNSKVNDVYIVFGKIVTDNKDATVMSEEDLKNQLTASLKEFESGPNVELSDDDDEAPVLVDNEDEMKNEDTSESKEEAPFPECDIGLVMSQTGETVTRSQVIEALKLKNGDIVEAIMHLT